MDSRPDLSWEPYPLHHLQPRSPYLHVLVVEAKSPHHPTPESTRTVIYTVPILPAVPLEVGRYIHLHLLCANKPNARFPQDSGEATALPMPIAGRLESERANLGEEMEFVLRNEIAEARVKTAIVRIRYVPNISVRSGTAGLLLDKLERLKADREGGARPEKAQHPMYPVGAEDRSGPSAQDLKWRAPLDAENWAVPRRKPRTAKPRTGGAESVPPAQAGLQSGVVGRLSKKRRHADTARRQEVRESHAELEEPGRAPIDAHELRDRSWTQA